MKQYGSNDIEVISNKNLYKGFLKLDQIIFKHRLFSGECSQPVSREIIRGNDAVAVLPYDPKLDQILLIEQIRIATLEKAPTPWAYEIIAGIAEDKEGYKDVAIRETKEEAGVILQELIPINSYFSSSGGSDEMTHLFLGVCSLEDAGGIYGLPEESEDIRSFVACRNDVFALLDSGRIQSASAIIALLWFKVNFEQLFGG